VFTGFAIEDFFYINLILRLIEAGAAAVINKLLLDYFTLLPDKAEKKVSNG
jgi:hypothetical protein